MKNVHLDSMGQNGWWHSLTNVGLPNAISIGPDDGFVPKVPIVVPTEEIWKLFFKIYF